ncbi:MAG: hypothetical protein DCO96_06565 [Fluviicola sp. XM-24bin1]|nr:MAG: hypothetical protein DCO96_06565 [Fluviicola sp. XM-24bin1]
MTGILFLVLLVLLFYFGPKYVWGFEAAYRRKLDAMDDESLMRERNSLVSSLNAGTSFERRRSYSVSFDKYCIVNKKLKSRGFKLPD